MLADAVAGMIDREGFTQVTGVGRTAGAGVGSRRRRWRGSWAMWMVLHQI
jgi:hypothetical protein